MSGVALKLLCWLDGFTSWSRRTCSWVTCSCHTTWYDEPLWQKKLDPTYSTTHAQTHARVVQRYWMWPLQSLPACLLHSTCLEGVWQGAHQRWGCYDGNDARAGFLCVPTPAQCPLHLWWHTIEVWDLALLRRWLHISNKMANARTQGFSVTSDIFQVKLISQRPPILVLGIFSLYWDCNILFMYGHNTTTTLSSSSQEVETNKELSYLCASTNNSSTGTTSVCGIGASLCPGSSLISTDEKFQKSRNNVAFQVAQVADSYGALMIGSKKSRNNSCLSPAIVI